MRKRYRLNAANTYQTIALDFDAVAMIVLNPTASPVLIRIGAPDIPDQTNADIIVASPYAQTYPVIGKTFGISLGNAALLTTGGSAALSGLLSVAIVEFLDKSEIIPTFGAYSFQSLSISLLKDLTAFSNTTTTPTFDLGSWGGAIVYVVPTAGSGQGLIQLEVSADQVTWLSGGNWAFWPNMPVAIQVSRRLRYFRISFGTAGIVGEPTIAGSYSVRATISEILSTQYLVIGASLTKSYVVGIAGTQSYTFLTTNMPAISVGINNTGVGATPRGQLIVEASQSAAGPWRLVAEREQSLATVLNNVFRSFGAVDIYMRVSILDTGASGLTGTLTMSVTNEPDQTGYLQNILSALGDSKNTPLVNQNIYAELDAIRLQMLLAVNDLNGVILWLTAIDGHVDAVESLINSSNILLAQINTNLTTSNTNLTSIIAALATVNGNLATVISNLSAISTTLLNIRADTASASQVIGTLSGATGAAGVWVNLGLVLPGNGFLMELSCQVRVDGQLNPGTYQLAFGNNINPTQIIYVFGSGLYHTEVGPTEKYDGPRSGGIPVNPASTNVWMLATASTTVQFGATFKYRP